MAAKSRTKHDRGEGEKKDTQVAGREAKKRSERKEKNNPAVQRCNRRGEQFQTEEAVTNQDVIQTEGTDRCSTSSEDIFISARRKMTHLACARDMLSKSVCFF